MRFPAEKNAGCPKAPRDFPPKKEPKKDSTLLPPPGCLGTLWVALGLRWVALGLPGYLGTPVRTYGR